MSVKQFIQAYFCFPCSFENERERDFFLFLLPPPSPLSPENSAIGKKPSPLFPPPPPPPMTPPPPVPFCHQANETRAAPFSLSLSLSLSLLPGVKQTESAQANRFGEAV